MTEIIKLNPKNMKSAVAKAVAALLSDGVIIYPTETAYALGTDACSSIAIKNLRAAKHEPSKSPISVIVANVRQAREIAKIGAKVEKLIMEFMPGPLTLVVEKKKKVPAALSRNTIAFRISSNKFAAALCKAFGSAITATSANLHGKPAIYSAKRAASKFSGKVDLIIDAGNLPKRMVSTIYDVGNKRVLREGPIKEKDIIKVLK